MVNKCIILACRKLPRDGISLHKLPVAEERKHWIDFIQKCNSKPLQLGSCTRVCARHFKTCCFELIRRNRAIKPGHFPTQIVGANGEINDSSTSNAPHNSPEIPMEVTQGPSFDELKEQVRILKSEKSSLEAKLVSAELKLSNKRTQLKVLRTTIARLRISQSKLKSTVRKFNEKPDMDSKSCQTDSSSEGTFDPLLTRKGKSYNNPTKTLVTKVSYYSAAAYNTLRKNSGLKLPHVRTIKRWSNWIETEPGFLQQPLAEIKEACNKNPKMKFVLVFDEMAIRSCVVHVGKKCKGYVDYGELKTPTKRKVATTAFFVYAASINGTIRLPIAYFLTNGSGTKLITDIIQSSLNRMADSNAAVIGVVFDGLAANFNACKSLGANFDFDGDLSKLKTSFPHPCTGANVYCLPDVCHMIKLLRNALNEFQQLKDQDGIIIDWKYFKEMMTLQTTEGLRAANRLTVRHIKFDQQKMKVRLSTQLMSNSVASGIAACHKMGLDQFSGSEATVKFAKIVNRLFDYCNSRPAGQGYKAPLSASNMNQWRTFFKLAKIYLMNLKAPMITMRDDGEFTEWKPLYLTRRGTCVKGWVMLITGIENILEQFVLFPDSPLSYLPTYRICQDVIELFFATIRRRLGLNNNPNIVQLRAALRSVLSVKLDACTSGNCLPMEDTRSSTITQRPVPSIVQQIMDECQDDVPDFPAYESLSIFVENVVVYIAGFVGQKVNQMLDCEVCQCSLSVLEPSLCLSRNDFVLVKEKQNGGLFVPSPDLIAVCKITEQEIRCQQTGGVDKLNVTSVMNRSLHLILQEDHFQDLRSIDVEQHSFLANHVLTLLKLIVSQYCKIRFHHIAKVATLELNPISIRNSCNRIPIFKGQ